MELIDRIAKFRLTCDVGTRHFHNGHEYVEIGGAKWATMNIGATSPTESGLYFQWGDTKGYTADQVGFDEGKKDFDWDCYKYKWTNNGGLTMSKYNALDGKIILDSCDDAVSAAWGGNWRMPTSKEFKALHNAVNAVWTNDYQGSGIAGFVLTDKADSSKVLFFLAAGCASNGSVSNVGIYGGYWSSSLDSDGLGDAYALNFLSSIVRWNLGNGRYYGYPMRGVVGN